MNESFDPHLANATTSTTLLGDPPHQPVARTARWRSWLFMCVIFAAGIAVGAAAATKYIHYRVRTLLLHPEQVPNQVVDVLQYRLSLTEPQTRQVAEIIRRHHAALERLRAEVSPQITLELTQLRTEVADVLTAEQLPRWQMFCAHLSQLEAITQPLTSSPN